MHKLINGKRVRIDPPATAQKPEEILPAQKETTPGASRRGWLARLRAR